jgi:hypothetical protein
VTELIVVRLTLFAVSFFVLQRLLVALVDRPNRAHGLGVLAASTLLSFVATALMLDRSLTDSLIAWSVIYLVIAVVWYLRWRLQDREAKLIEQGELRDNRGEG